MEWIIEATVLKVSSLSLYTSEPSLWLAGLRDRWATCICLLDRAPVKVVARDKGSLGAILMARTRTSKAIPWDAQQSCQSRAS